MKTIIILIAMVIIGAIANAQNFWTEHDVRISENGVATVYSQVQYTYSIKETGFSLSPYISTDYSWHEGLLFGNYQYEIFSGGVGAGLELTNGKAGFRWSPWLRIAPEIDPYEGGTLEVLSQWEFGNGKGNYWYSNSLIYQARPDDEISGQFGFIHRRFYGVGPVGGLKWKNNENLSITLKLGLFRDFEFDTVNLTPILTIAF